MPVVSVLLPFRNASRFIGAALASVQTQSFTDFEVIAVDDGSVDGSGDLARAVAAEDHRVRVSVSTGRGLPSALNDGCGLARGRYLARMDADDIARPWRLARQVAALDADPAIVVVGGSVDLIDEDDRPVGEIWYAGTDAEARAVLARGSTPFCHPAATIRREALEAVGGYRDACELAEDMDLWLRLAPLGRLQNLDEKVLAYRLHPASASYDRVITQIRSLYRALLINDETRTEADRHLALMTDEVWELASRWAPSGASAHLGQMTSWYVEQAVAAGYDQHIDRLIETIASVAPVRDQPGIAWMLWQAATAAAITARRPSAAADHLARGQLVLGAGWLGAGHDALRALREAIGATLAIGTSHERLPTARDGGYLDTVHWFDGCRRAFLYGWIRRPAGVPERALRLHMAGARPSHLSVERVLRHDVAREMGPGLIIAGIKVDVRFGTPAPEGFAIQASVEYADGRTAALEDANLLVRRPPPREHDQPAL